MVAFNTGGATREQRLPDDVVADLLAADRRRYAIEVLYQHDEALSVNDLAALVRAREIGESPGTIDAEECQDVREEFFQRHLPKLTATDVVRYDSVLGTVELVDSESFGDLLEDS